MKRRSRNNCPSDPPPHSGEDGLSEPKPRQLFLERSYAYGRKFQHGFNIEAFHTGPPSRGTRNMAHDAPATTGQQAASGLRFVKNKKE